MKLYKDEASLGDAIDARRARAWAVRRPKLARAVARALRKSARFAGKQAALAALTNE